MKRIPYGRHHIDDDDRAAVRTVLSSDFLTTGPFVDAFEKKIAQVTGAKYAVVVSSGTAALHLAYLAAGLGPGDEIVTSPLTFAATANAALYCGAKPVFADITEQGLIDPDLIERALSDKTKIIVPIHYAGMPCDLKAIHAIAKKQGLIVIEDACHALGSRYADSTIGDCAYSTMAAFSFHPVKHITTGEGGAITTNDAELYRRLKSLRHHGMVFEPGLLKNPSPGPWYHEMQYLGYNYRLTDIACALGCSQLDKLSWFIERRRELKGRYDAAFADDSHVQVLHEHKGQYSSYHLYPIRVQDAKTRAALFDFLRTKNIYCQVHYIPVYRHPYYQDIGYAKGLCPLAEQFSDSVISLPLFPDLSDEEQQFVIAAVQDFFAR